MSRGSHHSRLLTHGLFALLTTTLLTARPGVAAAQDSEQAPALQFAPVVGDSAPSSRASSRRSRRRAATPSAARWSTWWSRSRPELSRRGDRDPRRSDPPPAVRDPALPVAAAPGERAAEAGRGSAGSLRGLRRRRHGGEPARAAGRPGARQLLGAQHAQHGVPRRRRDRRRRRHGRRQPPDFFARVGQFDFLNGSAGAAHGLRRTASATARTSPA